MDKSVPGAKLATKSETKCSAPDVSLLHITQATTAIFSDLYFRMPFLFFIKSGAKKVVCPNGDQLLGEEGDLMIFPAGAIVTMENRAVLNKCYRADGVGFSADLIDTVFNEPKKSTKPAEISVLRGQDHHPFDILDLVKTTLDNDDLPPLIKRHRLLEPLIWLKDKGIDLSTQNLDHPLSKVRGLIETDLSHSWRAQDVAQHFAMSEPTLRRWLAKSDLSFSKILMNSRLEHGLTMLQATDTSILQIALECGFKTPSHFSVSFRKRFNIVPKMIRFTEI